MNKHEAWQALKEWARKTQTFAFEPLVVDRFAQLLEQYVNSLPPEERELATVILANGKAKVVKRKDYPTAIRKDPELAFTLFLMLKEG